MLIQKGGITRNIDEERLHEYAAKGYAPVAVAKPPADPPENTGSEKQPKKTNTKE